MAHFTLKMTSKTDAATTPCRVSFWSGADLAQQSTQVGGAPREALPRETLLRVASGSRGDLTPEYKQLRTLLLQYIERSATEGGNAAFCRAILTWTSKADAFNGEGLGQLSPEQLKDRFGSGTPLRALELSAGNFAQYAVLDLPTEALARVRTNVASFAGDNGTNAYLEVDETPEVLHPVAQKMLCAIPEITELVRRIQHQLPEASLTMSSSAVGVAINSNPNLILEGVPGTGKSHAILALKKSTYGDRVTTIVMHPATGYEDLIEGVRPANGELGGAWNLKPRQDALYFHECYGKSVSASTSNGQGPFVVRGGHFLIACANACANPTQKFLLVLDEINRCNVPRAFGELLLLIEASKRWEWNDQDNRWEGGHGATLPYSGLTFFVPDNLHVLGTMNTTDRSVAPLDQALRRRFAFHRLEPMEPDALKTALGERAQEPSVAAAIDAWHALNHELENKLGPDMMLGHSYFFDAKRAMERGEPADAAIRDMWRFAILPQLIDILHSANKSELAKHQKLVSHVESLDLELKLAGEGLHALLRVRSTDSKANG